MGMESKQLQMLSPGFTPLSEYTNYRYRWPEEPQVLTCAPSHSLWKCPPMLTRHLTM